MAASAPPTNPPDPNQPALTPRIRTLLSGIILFHLMAVVIAPFSFETVMDTGTPSPLAESAIQVFRPYVDAMFLNHGYAFFAPDPGPSHLVHYELEFDDGRAAEKGVFPDLNRQRPRLLYHRHFMLSEQLTANFVPAEPPPKPANADAVPEERLAYLAELESWTRRRQVYEAQWRSFEAHLLATHGARRVTLTRIEHLLITPYDRLRGRDLRDPELYVPLPETLSASDPSSEAIPGGSSP